MESKQRNLYEKQNLHGPFRDVGPCSEGPNQDLTSLIKTLNFILKAIKNHSIVSGKEITGINEKAWKALSYPILGRNMSLACYSARQQLDWETEASQPSKGLLLR